MIRERVKRLHTVQDIHLVEKLIYFFFWVIGNIVDRNWKKCIIYMKQDAKHVTEQIKHGITWNNNVCNTNQSNHVAAIYSMLCYNCHKLLVPHLKSSKNKKEFKWKTNF